MSVFLDTGLYYALQNESAREHSAAKGAFEAVLSGRYGTAFTSEYVYDEAVTLVRKRRRVTPVSAG
jgi:predicted nucleic acid-binding protein